MSFNKKQKYPAHFVWWQIPSVGIFKNVLIKIWTHFTKLFHRVSMLEQLWMFQLPCTILKEKVHQTLKMSTFLKVKKNSEKPLVIKKKI